MAAFPRCRPHLSFSCCCLFLFLCCSPDPPLHPSHRQKAAEQEAKLRTAIQDKNNFQLEKAGLERELKALRQQAEKLTKNMDKVGGCGGGWCLGVPAHLLWSWHTP